MAFTDAKIRGLKPQEKRYTAWEDGGSGLGVRVTPNGAKSFILMYRFDGTARMMTLGRYPALTLADARVKAANAKREVMAGADPGRQQMTRRAAERGAPTISFLVDEYLEKWARPRKRSAQADENSLRRDVLPYWGRRKAHSITRRDVIELLDRIIERGAPIQANRTLAVVRKMFNFAASRDMIPFSPCVAIPAPSKENRRDRVLSEEEIKRFWNGLSATKMSLQCQLALKLQLVTAQRIGEIIGMEWTEVDLQKRIWSIPSEKSKNGVAHRVPLSMMALDILIQLRNIPNDGQWVFPSPRSSGKPLGKTAVDHALRRNLAIIGLDDLKPHDLRRTAATLMETPGAERRMVIAKILNHVDRSVTAIYDRHSYDQEKRDALELWGEKIRTITSPRPENVVPLRNTSQGVSAEKA